MAKKAAKATGPGKSVSEQIAWHESEIRRLQTVPQNFQEYPKWITDKKDPSKGYIVQNAEEEAAHKDQGGGSPTFELTPEEQKAKDEAQAESDRDALRSRSRLIPAREATKAPKAAKPKATRVKVTSAKPKGKK